MTDSIVERVAKVLCRLGGHAANIRFEGQPMWKSYSDDARSVLTAVSQPTEAMISAARIEARANGTPVRQWEIEALYRVMIEAALAQ